MPPEPLHLLDPRRNFQLQGFTGRGATTTIHDASATGVSVSVIFQAAEDFAVLGLYNAYDYYNHLRLKHLPRTDLSGLALAFDIEYDHALDGAMRLDAAKYPSVSWDSMTFECGVGGPANTYEVRLLDHVTVVSGSETPATATLCSSVVPRTWTEGSIGCTLAPPSTQPNPSTAVLAVASPAVLPVSSGVEEGRPERHCPFTSGRSLSFWVPLPSAVDPFAADAPGPPEHREAP